MAGRPDVALPEVRVLAAPLNTQTAAALARDPATDVGQVTVDWAKEWFSSDPETVTAIADAMALSRDAVRQGLYLQPFAELRRFAIGLEPPPQMWLFEWDILTGDSATLDVLYADRRRSGRRDDRAGGACRRDRRAHARTRRWD